MLKTIKQLVIPPCIASLNLPLAFDNTLSYLEMVYSLISKLQVVIAELNKHTGAINGINYSLDELNAQITVINQNFDNLQKYIDTQDENLKNYTDEEINRIYNTLLISINTKIASLTDSLQLFMNEVDTKLENISFDNMDVMNPTNGSMENINKVLMDMYSLMRIDAITCYEYDSLELTAQAYDNKEITAYDFDLYGKTILMGNVEPDLTCTPLFNGKLFLMGTAGESIDIPLSDNPYNYDEIKVEYEYNWNETSNDKSSKGIISLAPYSTSNNLYNPMDIILFHSNGKATNATTVQSLEVFILRPTLTENNLNLMQFKGMTLKSASYTSSGQNTRWRFLNVYGIKYKKGSAN